MAPVVDGYMRCLSANCAEWRRESGAEAGRPRARLPTHRTPRSRQRDAAGVGGARTGQSRSGGWSLKMQRFGCCGHRDRPSAERIRPGDLRRLLQTDRLCVPSARSRSADCSRGSDLLHTAGSDRIPYGCAGPRPDGKQVVLFPSPVPMASRAAVGVRSRGRRAAVIESEGSVPAAWRPAAVPACCRGPATVAE